jgi:L-alanine-DL-glutamate epimerase-like enolase superfamily enzyme
MSRIVKIEIGRFDYAVAGEFKFFKPGPDGRVTRPSVLVRLTDENGVEGWGQAVPVPTWTYETVESVLTTLEHYLAEVVLGRDPADFAGLHAAMNTAIRPAFSVGQPLCKAALDLACHDLVGRQRGVPAWQLFGAPATARATLTLSWTVASPKWEVVERQLAEGRARGYRNFNIKVGAPQTAEYDLELARKVRAFAPDGFLWADANTGYTPAEALAMAPKLRDAGVDVLESPLPPTQIRGYQALKKQGALPVLMDEGIVGPEVAEEFIALDMLDGIAMKPARNAGLWPSVQIVNELRARPDGARLGPQRPRFLAAGRRAFVRVERDRAALCAQRSAVSRRQPVRRRAGAQVGCAGPPDGAGPGISSGPTPEPSACAAPVARL